MYGNGQVSKQHVIQAASNAQLSVPKDVLNQWLKASDPINRGIYSIPKLISFLERSQPHAVNRIRTGRFGSRPISKSSLNLSLSGGKSLEASWEKIKPLSVSKFVICRTIAILCTYVSTFGKLSGSSDSSTLSLCGKMKNLLSPKKIRQINYFNFVSNNIITFTKFLPKKSE